MKCFLTGSQYFFSSYKDFKPHDKDIIVIIEEDNTKIPDIYEEKADKFYINSVDKSSFLKEWRYRVKHIPMSICTFLIPEMCEEMGITIQDLITLKPFVAKNKLGKHHYLKIIFDSYIKNNSFTLTKEQRDAAYREYKKYRPQYKNKN